MDLGLAEKVVLVTGASGGIGRALVEVFAAEGAHLVLQGHRNLERLEAVCAAAPWREHALVVHADVTDPAALEDAFERALARFGRVDACIANAGVWPPDDRPLADLDDARLREVIEVNLFGALFTARAFLRALARTGPRADGAGAALVFTGSTAGRFGERGHADYSASKAALVGLARTLKNEITLLDPYGRVNVVEPGWTVSDMTRKNLHEPGVVENVVRTMALRQLARPVDVARTVAFLASPAARHVSGAVVSVAGGMEGRVLWEREGVDGDAVRARLAPDA